MLVVPECEAEAELERMQLRGLSTHTGMETATLGTRSGAKESASYRDNFNASFIFLPYLLVGFSAKSMASGSKKRSHRRRLEPATPKKRQKKSVSNACRVGHATWDHDPQRLERATAETRDAKKSVCAQIRARWPGKVLATALLVPEGESNRN
ncbi:hypothetical protein ANO11243_031920 [Dothideomycetidae sp. 11243]|nr:hypothetical protein ANO11243_031920 [fungal sp. No.11243]